MTLSTLQAIFQEIATKHKAINSFYSGLATEFNTNYEISYPAMLVDPVSINQSVRDGFFQNQWNIVLEIIDLLPVDRDMTDVNNTLDRTKRMLDQVLTKFVTDYNETTVTFNNETEKSDFTIQDGFTVLPLIDDTEKNHTGWQCSFNIVERVRFSTCCNEDVFTS